MRSIICLSRLLGVIVFSILIIACSSNESSFVLTNDGDRIEIEVALNTEEKKQGLMHREHLDKDAGMLFIFDDYEARSFWMKNTLIPLDVLHIDENKVVVDIITMPPCPLENKTCTSYRSEEASKYALEINAGMADELNIKIGDQLSIIITAND